MELKVRYENVLTEIELTNKDFDSLWVSLDLQGEGLSQQEKENLLQIEFDKRFNDPEKNNAHKFHRHRGYPASVLFDAQLGDDGDIDDSSEPNMSEVINPDIYRQQELKVEWQKNYDDVCSKVWSILAKKPHWAEAVIAIQIDGMSVNDYAASIGKEPSCISHWLERARRKLRNEYARHTEEVL